MKRLLFCLLLGGSLSCASQPLLLGDQQPERYLPLLEGRRVALFSNQTGLAGASADAPHILDVLLEQGVDVALLFSPEHGFRGTADAGEHVDSQTDALTGVPILSLYGGGVKLKDPAVLDRFDVLVVDIQDVGLRFYTYYITMLRLMEACSAGGKPVVLLDRPNPNGMYVDGPILEEGFYSGVGGLPIPVVHGLTLGEMARMALGEGWLAGPLSLEVVPCRGYTHATRYALPVAPSPNLKDMKAIYLYPSTCFFEGTVVSLGRGTEAPFEMYGHPDMQGCSFSFTPRSMPGAKYPPLQDRLCWGVDLRGRADEDIIAAGLDLSYVIDAYQRMGRPEDFFLSNGFFDLLAGNAWIREMIASGASAADIRARWQGDVEAFKARRAPYLLYPEL